MHLQDPRDPEWQRRTRRAAMLLALSGALATGLHVWAFLSHRSSSLALGMLFGPALVLVGAGGIAHPPVVYAFGPRRAHLTPRERMVGSALGAVGLAIGVVTTLLWFADAG